MFASLEFGVSAENWDAVMGDRRARGRRDDVLCGYNKISDTQNGKESPGLRGSITPSYQQPRYQYRHGHRRRSADIIRYAEIQRDRNKYDSYCDPVLSAPQ